MTTQSNVSSPIEVAPGQHFNWFLALAILVVGLLVGIFASNLSMPLEVGVPEVPPGITRNVPIRPNLIEAEKKANINVESQRNQAIAAEAARYTSLGLFYAAAGAEVNTQQAAAAETARYNGLAGFYGAAKTLAWPPRPTQFQPAGTAVMIENDLKRSQHDREYGLAAFGTTGPESHPLAWPPRPTQFHALKEAGPNEDIGLMEVAAIK